MIDGLTLNQTVEHCFNEAQKCIDAMLPLAERKANLTKEYRLAYVRKAVQLQDSGTRATNLDKFVKGNREVADLEYQITLAESEYDANHEAALLWKKRADYYRELGNREYSQAGENPW